MEQKKIYLSGKISGDPNFKEKFAQKEKELTAQGHLVFNPALHPDMFTWEQFMELDLKALANCDSIYLLQDWETSRGANIEYEEARRLGKEIIFENGGISKNKNLFEKLEKEFNEGKTKASDILNRVVSMAFENIHLSEEEISKISESLKNMVIKEDDKLKFDQRLLVSYDEVKDNNKEHKKINVQLSEYRQWKFRVALDDNSITPWQYFGHKPEGNDYVEIKKYYTELRESEKQQQQTNNDKTKSSHENNNKQRSLDDEYWDYR